MATRKSTKRIPKRTRGSKPAASAKRTAATQRKVTGAKASKAAVRKRTIGAGKSPPAAVRRAKTSKRGSSKGAAGSGTTAKAAPRKRKASESTSPKVGKKAVSKPTRSLPRSETAASAGSVSSLEVKRRRAPKEREAARTTSEADEFRIKGRVSREPASHPASTRGATRATRGDQAEEGPLEDVRARLAEIEASIKVLKASVRRLEKIPDSELDAMTQADLRKRADAIETGFLDIDDLENLKLKLLNEAFDSQRNELLKATNGLAESLESLRDTVAFIGAAASAIGIVANIIAVVK